MSNPTFIENMKLKFPEKLQTLCDPAFIYIVLAILVACLTYIIISLSKPSIVSFIDNTSSLSAQFVSILLCTFILSFICQTGEIGKIISWVLLIICIISWIIPVFVTVPKLQIRMKLI